jgi:hypothetical protein
MLTRAILLPLIFSTNHSEFNNNCVLLIRLLQDLLETGVIIVDDQGLVTKAIFQELSGWNQRDKTQAQILLKKLSKMNRFVEISLERTTKDAVCQELCQCCIEASLIKEKIFFLTHDGCFTCAKSQLSSASGVRVINSREYPLDEELYTCLNRNDYDLEKDQWNQDVFEEEVLRPLFRDSKYVQILDRQMGLYFHGNNGYEKTLEWMLKVFIRESNSKKRDIFEVHTSKPSSPSNLQHLKDLEAKLQGLHPKFRFHLKSKQDLPHDRYLRTDQIKITIGRGLDLLDTNDKFPPYPVRDVYIGLVTSSKSSK